MRDFDAVNRLITIEDCSRRFPVAAIGNAWSREYFDGPFYLFDPPEDLPAVSLVFVQSAGGNTVADDPSSLGGGPTDRHLLYEGLSRVAADAVMAGASSIVPGAFFTVHHPQLVALRLELGLPRHPLQVVLSRHGRSNSSTRLSASGVNRDVFARLRSEHGIRRISCIGGRKAATSLVDAGLVQDIYLTTSAIDGGEPETPWYGGSRKLRLETIVRKKEVTERSPLLFEHLAITA